MKKSVYVVLRDGEWAVQTENAQRAIKITNTQAEAIEYGREIAKNQQSELIILGKDGKIREKNSYGADPYPPKG